MAEDKKRPNPNSPPPAPPNKDKTITSDQPDVQATEETGTNKGK